MTTSKDLCEQHGMLIWPEVQILKLCAKMLPKNPVIVNIGAGVGTSAAAILEERSDAFIFSVDKDPAPFECDNLRLCEVDTRRCVRLLGRSWDVGKYFPYAVHMIFVDGAHHDEAVESDIVVWIPKIIPGGIAAFHDYKHPKAPGLTKIVNEYMAGCEVIDKHRYMIAYKIP